MSNPDKYYQDNATRPYPQTPADDRDSIWRGKPSIWWFIIAPLALGPVLYFVIDGLTR